MVGSLIFHYFHSEYNIMKQELSKFLQGFADDKKVSI